MDTVDDWHSGTTLKQFEKRKARNMKKKLAALLLCIGMLTELVCPITAITSDIPLETVAQTDSDSTD